MKFRDYQNQLQEGRFAKALGVGALATGLALGGSSIASKAYKEPTPKKFAFPPLRTSADFDTRDSEDTADVAEFEYRPNLALPTDDRNSPVTQEMLDFIKKFEGFYSKPYYDPAGVLTIGYGFTKDDIPNLNQNSRITPDEAEKFLEKRLKEYYIGIVRKNVTRPITQNQLIALTSLAYNVGEDAFKKSDVLVKLNKGDIEGASEAFKNLRFIHKKKSLGLERRRDSEKEMFLAKN
jgi:lysozyme